MTSQEMAAVPVREAENSGVWTLFYCPGCSRSFWAFGKEDLECFLRWHYHCWSAPCPSCGHETLQNDQYWR